MASTVYRCARAALVSALVPLAGLLAAHGAAPTVDAAAADLLGGAAPERAPAALLVVLSAGGAASAWAWLSAAVLACALAELRGGERQGAGRSQAAFLRPAALRLLVGLAVGPLAAGPAVADPAPPVKPPRLTTDPATLAVPARPLGTGTLARPFTEPRVVVRVGDTLWGVTARLLPHADQEAVAGSWPLLYRANRAAIGPDPDLVRPGLRLRVPPRLVPRPPGALTLPDRQEPPR